MATVVASAQFDQSSVNLYQIYSNSVQSFFGNNVNINFLGHVYADDFVVQWTNGGTDFYTHFLGPNLTSNATQTAVTGGTVTGIVELFDAGAGLQNEYALLGISLSGVAVYNAALTVSTTDDMALVAQALSGADIFNLSAFADLASGLAGNDTMNGNGGNDTLNGGAGNDQLIGGAGNDLLNGGTGHDSMLGGAGNDTYVVDSALDVVTEIAATGVDQVNATLSWTLGINFENLILLGANAINGTGNSLANALQGNSAANMLSGLAGADTLVGLGGNDTLLGGGDNDSLSGGAGNDSLNGGAGNDRILGDAGADSLVGAAGNDRLTGGGDADHFVYSAGASGSGVDTISDFTPATGDVIELQGLLVGAFAYISGAAFSGQGHTEARFQNGQVIFDLDGNGSADLRITLENIANADQLHSADFLFT